MNEIRYVDGFSGIGGVRLGLEGCNDKENRKQIQSTQNGQKEIRNTGNEFLRGKWDNGCSGQPPKKHNRFKHVWSNDFNKYANQIYTKNFGEKNHHTGDIRGIPTEEIPDHDLLCAGFPCQAFSVAGKRKGFKETRGTLFFEICRIAEAKRPSLLLLENVKGLLNHDGGNTFSVILQSLDELGYWVEWQVLNSKHFGVPQNRERVFIIGHLRNRGGGEIFPIGETSQVVDNWETGKQIASTLQHPGHSGGNYRGMNMINLHQWRTGEYGNGVKHEESFTLDSGSGRDYVIPIGSNKPTVRSGGRGSLDRHAWDTMMIKSTHYGKSQQDRVHDINGISPTIPTSRPEDKTKITDGIKIRRLTPIECERLQGFPDNWTLGVSDTQRYKCLGNAVTVNVIEFLGTRLLESWQCSDTTTTEEKNKHE